MGDPHNDAAGTHQSLVERAIHRVSPEILVHLTAEGTQQPAEHRYDEIMCQTGGRTRKKSQNQ